MARSREELVRAFERVADGANGLDVEPGEAAEIAAALRARNPDAAYNRPEPQRATVFAYADGTKSQGVEVTVEAEIRHGAASEMERLATIVVDYRSHGNVVVNVEKHEPCRDLRVEVDS